MYSDEEEGIPNYAESISSEGYDKKMEELWSRKRRRRSSDLKIPQQDKLKLQHNPKMAILLTKNSKAS